MKELTFEDLEEKLDLVQGAVRFAMEEGTRLEASAKIAYAVSMFWCAINETDVMPESVIPEALGSLQAKGYYHHAGFIFRVENPPTGPRCWVDIVSGVPEQLATLYRTAVESDASIAVLAGTLGQLANEASAGDGNAKKKAQHTARRVAYWLQERPEFKGLSLKQLEMLCMSVSIGMVQRLEVPAREMLKAVSVPPAEHE